MSSDPTSDATEIVCSLCGHAMSDTDQVARCVASECQHSICMLCVEEFDGQSMCSPCWRDIKQLHLRYLDLAKMVRTMMDAWDEARRQEATERPRILLP